MKKYQLIYADPAWQYKDKRTGGSYQSGAAQKYKVMPVGEMFNLPIQSIAADDCLLAMWHVAPMPLEAINLVHAWGFTLKTMKGFTWHKITKNGLSHFGMGHYTRANTEDCLFAIRGKPKIVSHSVRQFIEAPIRAHSQKPDEARERLTQLVGDVPRVELFARQTFEGWDSWGDEIESDFKLAGVA